MSGVFGNGLTGLLGQADLEERLRNSLERKNFGIWHADVKIAGDAERIPTILRNGASKRACSWMYPRQVSPYRCHAIRDA